MKIVKEKLVKEDIDASHLTKSEQTVSLLSNTSPSNIKTVESKTTTRTSSLPNTPEVIKSDLPSDKASAHNSQENFFPATTSTQISNQGVVPISQILLASPSNTLNSQISPSAQSTNLFVSTQPSPIIASVSLKSLKKKENPPVSPKSSANKDTNKDARKSLRSNASPKSYLKIQTDKQEKLKKKVVTQSHESPGKEMSVRNSFVNTSQENLPENDSLAQSALSQQESKPSGSEFVRYYKQEKAKLNIWTYLFKNLTNSISQIYNMCDLENSIEFNNGVISTLEAALEDMKKLNKKIELDNMYLYSRLELMRV